jgi:hypothetical protein
MKIIKNKYLLGNETSIILDLKELDQLQEILDFVIHISSIDPNYEIEETLLNFTMLFQDNLDEPTDTTEVNL